MYQATVVDVAPFDWQPTKDENLFVSSLTHPFIRGPLWISRLGKKGYDIDCAAEKILRANMSRYLPEDPISKLCGIKGTFFPDHERRMNQILKEGSSINLTLTHEETSCAILDVLTPDTLEEAMEKMGVEFLLPIPNPFEVPYRNQILGITKRGLTTFFREENTAYDEDGIFIFYSCSP